MKAFAPFGDQRPQDIDKKNVESIRSSILWLALQAKEVCILRTVRIPSYTTTLFKMRVFSSLKDRSKKRLVSGSELGNGGTWKYADGKL